MLINTVFRIPLDYLLSRHRLDTAQRAPPFVVLMEEKITRAIEIVALLGKHRILMPPTLALYFYSTTTEM